MATASTIGLAAGVAGLLLPVTLILLATYAPGVVVLPGAELLQAAAILGLTGAILFALSLLVYRLGFNSLSHFDRRFRVATVLSLVGTVGVLLIVVTIAIAFTSSDSMANCIRGAPTHSFACLRAAAPLAPYAAALGALLLWFGGLGVVVGIGLASVRYREGWLGAGAGLYALLLLGLIGPILGLLIPVGALTYPLLIVPALALLAPAVTARGCSRATDSRTGGGSAAASRPVAV